MADINHVGQPWTLVDKSQRPSGTVALTRPRAAIHARRASWSASCLTGRGRIPRPLCARRGRWRRTDSIPSGTGPTRRAGLSRRWTTRGAGRCTGRARPPASLVSSWHHLSVSSEKRISLRLPSVHPLPQIGSDLVDVGIDGGRGLRVLPGLTSSPA